MSWRGDNHILTYIQCERTHTHTNTLLSHPAWPACRLLHTNFSLSETFEVHAFMCGGGGEERAGVIFLSDGGEGA